MNIVILVGALVVGFLFLTKGSDWFVDGASGIAEYFGIPQLVIGLTIVAMGTSAPEATVSLTAAFENNAGITIGNVVGSNILNILLILGITGVMTSIKVQKSTLWVEIPFMILITVALIPLGMSAKKVDRWEGILLLILFLIYLSYLFIMAKKGKTQNTEKKKAGIWKYLAMTVLGICIVIAGSKLAVYGATGIAELLHVEQRIIGLTIVAFGTSLPELFASVTAARKGNADIAIGNIVGSNIFNILFIIGLTTLVIPVEFEKAFIYDTVVAVVTGLILFVSLLRKRTLRRPAGIVMLFAYSAYLVYLIIK